MNRSLLSIATLFFILSCTNKGDKPEKVVPVNQTPEVLDDKKNDFELKSISKRYNSNIIDELFEEAKLKDEQLDELAENIDGLGRKKIKDLEAYSEYQRNNNLYWSAASTYINQVKDSTLKSELRVLFEKLEARHRKRIANHEAALVDLAVREHILSDQEIIMKLIVTEPMMSNYQRNEIPEINDITKLTKEFDALIEKTREYTVIKK